MNSDTNGNSAQLSPLFRAPGTGPELDVLGVTHSYKATASDTGRQFSVWESIEVMQRDRFIGGSLTQ